MNKLVLFLTLNVLYKRLTVTKSLTKTSQLLQLKTSSEMLCFNLSVLSSIPTEMIKAPDCLGMLDCQFLFSKNRT